MLCFVPRPTEPQTASSLEGSARPATLAGSLGFAHPHPLAVHPRLEDDITNERHRASLDEIGVGPDVLRAPPWEGAAVHRQDDDLREGRSLLDPPGGLDA